MGRIVAASRKFLRWPPASRRVPKLPSLAQVSGIMPVACSIDRYAADHERDGRPGQRRRRRPAVRAVTGWNRKTLPGWGICPARCGSVPRFQSRSRVLRISCGNSLRSLLTVPSSGATGSHEHGKTQGRDDEQPRSGARIRRRTDLRTGRVQRVPPLARGDGATDQVSFPGARAGPTRPGLRWVVTRTRPRGIYTG